MPFPVPGWAFSTGLPGPRSRILTRRFAGPCTFAEAGCHLRIAHLTDQHVGRVTPYEIQREAIDITNDQNPDLVVLTGDFVCHSQLYLDQLTDLIRRLKAPALAVLGNHDHWAGAGEVRTALERGGAQVLSNQHTIMTFRDHQPLQIVGLDDAYTGHADREKAVKGLRADLPTLGLSHIAEEADGLWACGVPLVLSGHTHGGQITVARLHEWSLGRLSGHKYVHGLYGSRTFGPATRDTGAVYVGAGIGAAVMPLRFGERGQREVAIFDLGQRPGAFPEHHSEQEALPGRKPSVKVKARRAAKVVEKRERRSRRQTSQWPAIKS